MSFLKLELVRSEVTLFCIRARVCKRLSVRPFNLKPSGPTAQNLVKNTRPDAVLLIS